MSKNFILLNKNDQVGLQGSSHTLCQGGTLWRVHNAHVCTSHGRNRSAWTQTAKMEGFSQKSLLTEKEDC